MSSWMGGAVDGSPFAGSPGSVISVVAALGRQTGPIEAGGDDLRAGGLGAQAEAGLRAEGERVGRAELDAVMVQVSWFWGDVSVGSPVAMPAPPDSSVDPGTYRAPAGICTPT